MNKQIAYIALYRALECIEQETNNEKLSDFLDKANPYIFKDRKSADPVFYKDFSVWIDENKIELNEQNSFAVVNKYVTEKTEFTRALEIISEEEWNALIEIIKNEESELNQ